MGRLFLIVFLILTSSMSKNIILEIRNNYGFYLDLKNGRKSILNSEINIRFPKPHQRNFLLQNSEIRHEKKPCEIILISEVKVDDHKCFQFKLQCVELCQTPFFRYDSDGATHRNYDETIPLKEQQVSPPHFHVFNENGISIAYKTDQLKNEGERKALEDIGLCIVHFCIESNIRLNDSEFPAIRILPDRLPFVIVKYDPNLGAQFI